ncbi:MAG: sulfite exporter TauE/SafE family protein [Chloroflexi bacterium]|nr:sulfite exporter TauE/SafE family protein [Chloroflexota bacterium]
MKLRIAIVLATLLASGLLLSARTRPVAAHPLGNFTINHSTTIELAESGVTVVRVLDMAEIPTFQALQGIPTGADGEPDLDAWARARSDELRQDIHLTISGSGVDLRTASHDIALRDGQGGLQTLRLVVTYTSALPDGWRDAAPTLAFEDHTYPDRIGWREVIARGGPGVQLVGSDLPVESATQQLLSYPEGSLSSPPDVREASFSFRPGVRGAPLAPADPDHRAATRGNPDGTLGRFAGLISRKELSASFLAFALLAAVAFGAIHALSPGHGKTVVAAYLIGSRGTLRHALILGLTVTATHTSSVYVLGFVTLYLSQYIVPEDLYPWMGIISGAIILLMGLSLFIARLRTSGLLSWAWNWSRRVWFPGGPLLALATPAPIAGAGQQRGATHNQAALAGEPHNHGHASHAHDSGEQGRSHRHGWSSHSHAVPGSDGEAVTWQRLVGLGIFGGMIPCPSAIVVMLSAIALHRVGFGLVLIVAFSAGLAAVLTGIGFVLVWAQRAPLLRRLVERTERIDGPAALLMRTLPVAAAALVFAVGVVLISRAAGQL